MLTQAIPHLVLVIVCQVPNEQHSLQHKEHQVNCLIGGFEYLIQVCYTLIVKVPLD